MNSTPLPTVSQKAVQRSCLAQRLALNQGGAESEVGEDQHQAREHERGRREAVLARREQSGDDDRHDEPRELQHDLGRTDPGEAPRDAVTHVLPPRDGVTGHRIERRPEGVQEP